MRACLSRFGSHGISLPYQGRGSDRGPREGGGERASASFGGPLVIHVWRTARHTLDAHKYHYLQQAV